VSQSEKIYTMPKILLIDDSSVNNFLLESILEDEGYEILSTNNAAEGLRMVKSERPDLVLLDIMMPEMDGFTVLENIRADESVKDILVIMVTADLSYSSKKKAIEGGADDYIHKPVDINDVVAKVNSMLKR